MPDYVICNCFDAGAFERWAYDQGILVKVLRNASTGKIYLRGLAFCPAEAADALSDRSPERFKLRFVIDPPDRRATCSAEEVENLVRRAAFLTGLAVVEEMVLPNVGDQVSFFPPAVETLLTGEVVRVSPSTGNIRVFMGGLFWTVPAGSLQIIGPT